MGPLLGGLVLRETERKASLVSSFEMSNSMCQAPCLATTTLGRCRRAFKGGVGSYLNHFFTPTGLWDGIPPPRVPSEHGGGGSGTPTADSFKDGPVGPVDGFHAQLAGESVDENADSSKDGPERTGKLVTTNHLGCNTISPMKETLRDQFLAGCVNHLLVPFRASPCQSLQPDPF